MEVFGFIMRFINCNVISSWTPPIDNTQSIPFFKPFGT